MDNNKTNSQPLGKAVGGRLGGTAGEKAKDFSGTWKRLFSYCKPWIPAVCIALLMGAMASVISIYGPDQLGKITDLIGAGLMGVMDITAITEICMTLVFLYAIGFIFTYIQGYMMSGITQKVSRTMRGDISRKLNRLPLRYYDSASTGDLLSRVTNDVDTIGQTLNQSISGLTHAVLMLAGILIMMVIINPILALTALASTAIGFLIMSLIIKRSQQYFAKQQKYLGSLNGHVEEIYSGHTIVKAYNGETAATRSFDEINENMITSARKAQFMSSLMQPIMSFVGNLGYVAVCVVGAALAINGVIGFGVIVSFILYVRLLTQPLNQLAQAANTLQNTAAAAERVFEFLDAEEQPDEDHKTITLTAPKGNVLFRNVSFGYSEDKQIINDFNADAYAGKKVAIVGPTGAGKTTIVNLLMRFYEINDGKITIDGVSTASLTRENVHDLFCMVLQDTWLFEGTIRENICYNNADISDETLDKACEHARLKHFIDTLPQGYDTVLAENNSLSAGQKQLLTIARALVKDAPLLILDEATSSVDTRTELQIQNAMDTLMAGRTSFVIAHRLSTIKNADLILVMKDGGVVESGTHEQLMYSGGMYADLYNSQFVREENRHAV